MIFRSFVIFLFFCSVIAVAGEELPRDPRLLFNYGAELAAAEKLDEAVDVLRQVAIVRDKTIAAKALSLLGQIAVSFAQQNVSDNPTETPPEQRQIILDHLKSAEQSFTESLSLLSNNDVRQHLETLRAWRHNIIQLWNDYDRKQQRNTELQQRIQWLADWEKKLTEQIRPLTEEPDSPRKFQTEYESSREQKKLAEELTMLQDIPISDEKNDDEKNKEQWAHLPEIQKIADEAAELLLQHQASEALPKQQQVLDYLQSLLKQEQDQQNQDQQNQDQQEQNQKNDNQEQQNQEPQKQESQEQNKDQQEQQKPQPQSEEQKEKGEQKQEKNQPQSSPQESSAQTKEEEAKEKAERLLLQVRRKEQAAEKRREQLRALQLQAEPVEKDW